MSDHPGNSPLWVAVFVIIVTISALLMGPMLRWPGETDPELAPTAQPCIEGEAQRQDNGGYRQCWHPHQTVVIDGERLLCRCTQGHLHLEQDGGIHSHPHHLENGED